jgi:hypothetical protein
MPCVVCTVHMEMRSTCFLFEPQNQGRWFISGLGLKTGSYSVVIWASKSPRRFLGLCLKTKRAMVCRLCHKTDRKMKMAWGTRWDLAAWFAWKQVGLGFPSLASRLSEARRRVVHVAPSWRSREDQVEDGWVDATSCIGPYYPYFIIFDVLGPRAILVFKSFAWAYK